MIDREHQRIAAILALEVSEAPPIWVKPPAAAPRGRFRLAGSVALSIGAAFAGAALGALVTALLTGGHS